MAMKKVISNKVRTSFVNNVLPIEKGGTGATTLEDALKNLNLISNLKRNQANGILGVDSSGKAMVPITTFLPGNHIVIDGPSSVPQQTTVYYTIVGYSRFKEYNVSANDGLAWFDGWFDNQARIAYRAPIGIVTDTLTVNGKNYPITITNATSAIVTPVITYPIHGTNNHGNSLVIKTAPYSYIGAPLVHETTTWLIADNVLFNNPIVNTDLTNDGRYEYVLNGLAADTTYYVKVTFNGPSPVTVSASSGIVSFKTRNPSEKTYLEVTALSVYTKSNNGAFGKTIAVSGSGNRIVIAEHNKVLEGTTSKGTVHVFKKIANFWRLETSLAEETLDGSRFFGYSVSISDDGSTIAVAAVSNEAAILGKVYVYKEATSSVDGLSDWSLSGILEAVAGDANDLYGASVSVSSDGTYVAVGSPNTTSGGLSASGAVYMYKSVTGTYQANGILTPTDKAINDNFGNSVALNSIGDKLVIGAVGATRGGLAASGAAYVYSNDGTTWVFESDIVPNDRTAGDSFGSAVAIADDGKSIIVGAKDATRSGTKRGQAYVFKKASTWSQNAILISSVPSASTNYGASVAMSGDGYRVVIGATDTNRSGILNAGLVTTHMFKSNTWTETNMLLASDETTTDRFGSSVSISKDGGVIVIGAPEAIRYGAKVGMAYVYS